MSKEEDYKVEHWSRASATTDYQNKAPIEVTVNDRAATREAIINKLRSAKHTVQTRSDWKAQPELDDTPDWNYKGIAIHHAGNSYSCDVDGTELIKKAEKEDSKKFGYISYHYAIACDGTIYEARDIRAKGAHIQDGNSRIIGIVMLSDLSRHGEAYKEEYGALSLFQRIKGVVQWGPDLFAARTDEPQKHQIESLFTLVKTLLSYFQIKELGGHREYQRIANGVGRACPGVHGMILVDMLRKEFQLAGPSN